MIDQNTKEVFDKAFDLLKQGVVAAADTLRTYAPQLWAMVRRQVIIDGIEYVAEGLLALLVAAVIVYFVRRGYKDRPDFQMGIFDKTDTNTLTVLVLAVGLVICGSLLVNACDYLLNPDFWTLQRIMEMRK